MSNFDFTGCTFSNYGAPDHVSMASIKVAVEAVQKALEGSSRPAKVIYVRHDVWPRMKAEIEKLATVPAESTLVGPVIRGIPIRIVEWDLPVPWCTDVEFDEMMKAVKR